MNDYMLLSDQFISLYKNIQEIFSINLNDAFKKNNYNKILTNKLLKDTEIILALYNNDINKILNLKSFPQNGLNNVQLSDNLFIKYTLEYENLIANNLIINNENENIDGHFILNIDRNKIYKAKKEHEVKKLSEFIKNTQTLPYSQILFEIGCGKSYLTDALLSTKDNNFFYIGVDMKKIVIEKSKQKYKNNKNVYLLNSFINFDNFNEFYENQLKPILLENNQLNKNIFLFGLHSCGNLTSNTLKIFINNSFFKSIAIVGCCLALLNEYINPETKSSKEFINYYNCIGYNKKKGKFLDNSLIYELNNNENNIGYPLSKYIQNKSNFFFGKDVRNAAMLNNSENASYDSISTQKNFFRALTQKFIEDNLEEYANVYGLGKHKYEEKCTFSEYINYFLFQIQKNETKEDVLKKIEELIKDIDKINKFYEDNKFLSFKHYALTLIRIKFAKIVEYIVALDRIIYLIEKGINNVKLIRIFNNHISPRNLLIFAKKD